MKLIGVAVKRWFTFEEIAAELDIPLQSLYFYRRRGDGPKVHKFGKHLRVLEDDLRAWQSSQLTK